MRFINDADRGEFVRLKMLLLKEQSWIRKIQTCLPDAEFKSPASSEQIRQVETVLGNPLPKAFVELLRETNGVTNGGCDLVYPTDLIIRVNQEFRAPDFQADSRMPFDHLVLFGTASGDGDECAFPVLKNGSVEEVIFVWSHETDCRERYAFGLNQYFIHAALRV